MNALIERIRCLRFWPRVILFHSTMILAGLAYVASTKGWLSLILGSLMIGAAAAATFHSWRPYCYGWTRMKAFGIRLAHGTATLLVIYLCLWGRFLEYGALVGESISWAERLSGFFLAGFGFLLAGIFLGKGRFEPDPIVLAPK